MILFVSGCASTYSTRSVEPSGFLGDYSQMRAGAEEDVQLIYVNPQADFGRYRKIMMDPVSVYVTPDSYLRKVPKEQLSMLVNELDAAIKTQLTPHYEFVHEPQAGAMRLRIAITEAQGANVALDTVSTVVPVGLAISAARRAVFGTHSSIGKAGIEMEILDAETGQRLWAMVDERAGRKITGKFDKFSKWRTTHDASEYWADLVKERLESLQAEHAASTP
ncbi:MAG: hypothetical protein A2X46_09900 [Lentisphaerae bacterium GWF2_57_35]|nr:MAG: hypothetical protein A2X46_09900 [Lentisphaerae bacterium GWF2_57_35]